MKLIVIIPAYDEEDGIGEILRLMPDLKDEGIKLIPVVIDDGSHDHTAEYARAKGAIVLRHEKNEGLGKTIQDGINYSLDHDADIMVNIDADLQYNPGDIKKLIQPIIDNEADFVTADRFSEAKGKKVRPDNMPVMKFWGNQIMTRMVNSLAGTSLGDVSSGFRAMNREALLNLNLMGKYTYTHETIIDLAFKHLRLMSLPILVKYYPERKSKVAGNLPHYTIRTMQIILKVFRDYRPFYFFSLLAFFPFLFGIGMLIFMLYHFILTGEFSPYKFIAFTGIYLFSLGLLLIIFGFLADILVGIRLTSEKQLYLQKKSLQKKDS